MTQILARPLATAYQLHMENEIIDGEQVFSLKSGGQ